jgi:hypothetical protein
MDIKINKDFYNNNIRLVVYLTKGFALNAKTSRWKKELKCD